MITGKGVLEMNEMPIIDIVKTGENINRLRKERNITVRELQEIFGFGTPQAIYKWQHGTTLPTLDNLVVLASVLHVSIDDIVVLYKKREPEAIQRKCG